MVHLPLALCKSKVHLVQFEFTHNKLTIRANVLQTDFHEHPIITLYNLSYKCSSPGPSLSCQKLIQEKKLATSDNKIDKRLVIKENYSCLQADVAEGHRPYKIYHQL